MDTGRLVLQIDDDPVANNTRLVRATLWVGIGVLAAADAFDGIRTLRRRAAYRLSDGWARIERRERSDARRGEIVALVALVARANSRRATESPHPSGRPHVPAGRPS